MLYLLTSIFARHEGKGINNRTAKSSVFIGRRLLQNEGSHVLAFSPINKLLIGAHTVESTLAAYFDNTVCNGLDNFVVV